MTQIAEINALTEANFVSPLGDVAEHSPWVRAAAAKQRPFADRAAMVAAFVSALRNADRAAQLALIRAHPDLASRARLTTDSAREQAGVGLESLTAEELRRFTEFNDRHSGRFDIPFIFDLNGTTMNQTPA